jgi:hypothetical protein
MAKQMSRKARQARAVVSKQNKNATKADKRVRQRNNPKSSRARRLAKRSK